MAYFAPNLLSTIVIDKHNKYVQDILERQNDFVSKYDLSFRNPSVVDLQTLADTWLQKGHYTLDVGFTDVSIDIICTAREIQKKVLYNVCKHGSGTYIVALRDQFEALEDQPPSLRKKIENAQDSYRKATKCASIDTSIQLYSEAIKTAIDALGEFQ